MSSPIDEVDITTPDETNDEVENIIGSTVPPEESETDRKRKKRRTSTVWNDVTEVVENGITFVKCNHCATHLSYTKGGPTTHFKRHIDSCIIRRTKISGQGTGSIQTMLSADAFGTGAVTTYKYDKELIKDLTAKMIMVHEYPFMIVEHINFRMFCRQLNPKYEFCGRAAIRDHCMKLYKQEKQMMKLMFADVGRISLTSDLWTSNQTKGYMCITGHFLDNEWKLQNRILNFCLLPPPHTGVAIADKIYACLSEWGIEDKISTITFDNASSNDAAIRSLKEQFEGRNALYFGGKIFHIRCCAHILNLLVQDGLSSIKSVIENVRESVKYILLSSSRLHKWNEVVKNMCLPTNKTLILDCVTRWNSTFYMLERALIFKDAFARFASRDPLYQSLPSGEDWERATDVCKFLFAFDEVTKVFSGREYTTANLYLPEIWRIKQILDEKENDPRDFMNLMVRSMKSKFDKYWKECNIFMIIAAILDPRNKLDLVRFVYENLYGELEVEERITDVVQEMHLLFDDYVAKFRGGVREESGQGRRVESSSEGSKGRNVFESWRKTRLHVIPTQAKKELDIYLEESALIDGGDEFDVLMWWKSNTLKFPTLSKMARDILSIPVTTVPSESAFSAGRRVISDDRCSLGDDTIEGLLCGANWFRYEHHV